MLALRRPKTLIPALIIVAAIIVGVLAVKSRGSDDKPLSTIDQAVNCPPVARADAAATKPGEPISINVLANDTDPDSDPLVFQILKTEGGTSAVDDGGTPTDSADDRLRFTPDEPPTDTAAIEYQALDPQGGFSSSTVAVYINPQALLPEGVHSEAATDPVPAGTDAGGRCGAPTSSTVLDAGTGPIGPETSLAPETTEVTTATTKVTTSGRRTTTTTKKKSTTTTAKKTTTTVGSSPTTPPTQPATTSTTKPKPPKGPTTTVDYSDNPCVINPNSQACTDWKNQQLHPTTTAKPTTTTTP